MYEGIFIFNSRTAFMLYILSIIISSNCYAQEIPIPLNGQLEVTDKINGLSWFDGNNLSNAYNENGVMIWQLPQNKHKYPYIENMIFYAKIEDGNISVMLQGENESTALRGLIPAMHDKDYKLFCNSDEPCISDDSPNPYDDKSSLIYHLLQKAFEDLKEKSAIPDGASLAKRPFYMSSFSNKSIIFEYFIEDAKSTILGTGFHNFGEQGAAYESANVTFDLSPVNPTGYLIYGEVKTETIEDSRLFLDDGLWLKDKSEDMKYGDSDFPFSIKFYGKKNWTAEKDYTVFAMAWVAINASDLQVDGRVKAVAGNGTEIPEVREYPDVLESIEMGPIKPWPSLKISNLLPANNSIMPSRNVTFSWNTTRNSSTNLFIRESSEEEYQRFTGDAGRSHSLSLRLVWNTSYDFYVLSNDSYDVNQSQPRRISIGNGVEFTQRVYEPAPIPRDYDQRIFLVAVRNTDIKPHEIRVYTNESHDDLFLGFIGNGSLNTNLTLAAGEERILDMVINAQDARQDHYDIAISLNDTEGENISDSALLRLKVDMPTFDITINVIGEDKETLVQKIRIENHGKVITDLSVTLAENIRDDAYLYPNIIHYRLDENESVDFYAIPIFSENDSIIQGELIASGANKSKNRTLRFNCSDGKGPNKGIAEMAQYVLEFDAWYCPNNDSIKIPFDIPPGFNQTDILKASLEMNFSLPWDRSTYRPHDVHILMNGNPVDSITNEIPEGRYVFDVRPDYVNCGNHGPAENLLAINTVHLPQTHYVVITDIRLRLCLKKIERWMCAPNESRASELVWKIPGISRSYPTKNVSILQPINSSNVTVEMPTLINVSVMGRDVGADAEGPQLYSEVTAIFSNGDDNLKLYDDGKNGDGVANDGIYASIWTPQNEGCPTTITVRAADCRENAEGNDSAQVCVIEGKPDLIVPDIGFHKSVSWSGESATAVTFNVSNIGDKSSGAFNCSLTIDGRPFPLRHESLPTDQTIEFTYVVEDLPSVCKLSVCVDPENQIEEFDEVNNCLNATVCTCNDTRKMRIKVTDQSGSDLNDYPVLIELKCSNYSQALNNGSKLRILEDPDSSGRSLSYWIEENDPAAMSAKVWVKIPHIPANGTSVITLGLPGSEDPNGRNTFDFFDDFNDGSLDSSLWNARIDPNSNSRVEENGGEATIHAKPNEPTFADLTSSAKFKPSMAIKFRANITNAQRNEWKGMGLLSGNVLQDIGAIDEGVYWRMENGDLYTHHKVKVVGGEPMSRTNHLPIDEMAGYKIWEIKWIDQKDDQIQYYYLDGILADTHWINISDDIIGMPAGFSVNLSAVAMPSEMNLDWVLVRKCAYPEPNVSIAGCN